MPLARNSWVVARLALDKLADEDLMELARRGDARAFAVIYDRHATVAYSLAYRITGNGGAAEDVVQECFLGLWRAAMRYDPSRGSVRTWVLAMVRNRAIDSLRRALVHSTRRAADDGLMDHVAAADRTDVQAARRGEAREVRAALESLPPEQSRVIQLAYYGGFTHAEIATMLEMPVGTIKGRMRLGLEKLRNHLASLAPEAIG